MNDLPFDYEGPSPLGDTVATALRRVTDPELAMDIVDVGLVYGVALQGDQLQVRVTMTSAACPVTEVIVEDIERELDAVVPPELFIRVDVVWDPPWSPERMSGPARTFMGW
jgi:metal-sulfur cluster biosynthetic enzyme